ncbi:PREDICTED: multiple organellar RNA editing factor 8, chloroplastic/mitochondrial-like [Nelumbo nucifera]|uniref:Multiple organellar RNA editing factor 8, chloroplastic/mitochondrial-like n=1 Tax=Nelumbo nucifera TaxID=4432 RepID=A0A1U8APP8_NELNU|nr:PREDICTED: multiple organellar RNA editing factor 8, chloroplastic/mitochondrial-like [Nelumbo nucifera]
MIPRRALVSLRRQAAGAASKPNTTVPRFSSTYGTTKPNLDSLFNSALSQNQKKPSLRYLSCYCPWVSVAGNNNDMVSNGVLVVRNLSTRSMNDSSNRPPKETILLDGCDFEHWLVVMEPPDPNITRDEIIDSYIKTLAQVLGSEDEARRKIYSVSTRHYFAFGCLVSEELSYKIKELPRVRWVLPDSYLDVKNKSYGGEPFIDGQAVPYDPKYHEEWVRNNARANERSRRNDRPRNYDRSRNFERRRENMMNRDMPPPPPPSTPNSVPQNQGGPNQGVPPVGNHEFQNQGPPSPMPNQTFASQTQNVQPPNLNVPPPVQNPGFQNRPPPPPPMQNRDFQNSYTTHPVQNQNFQARDMNVPPQMQNWNTPPPVQNWNSQIRDTSMPPATPNWNSQPPPTQTWNSQGRDMNIPPPPPAQTWNSESRGMNMPPSPVQTWNSQNRDMNTPPTTQNWNSQSRDIPPPSQNWNYQSRDVRPPVQNQDFQARDIENVSNSDYQNRGTHMGGLPNGEYHSREMPTNMGVGNIPSRDYQDRDVPGNISMNNAESRSYQKPSSMNMGNTPNRDYQTRDMPSGDYEPVASRNF